MKITKEQETKIDEMMEGTTLVGGMKYIAFDVGEVTLDGQFTLDDLRKLVEIYKYLEETTKL